MEALVLQGLKCSTRSGVPSFLSSYYELLARARALPQRLLKVTYRRCTSIEGSASATDNELVGGFYCTIRSKTRQHIEA